MHVLSLHSYSLLCYKSMEEQAVQYVFRRVGTCVIRVKLIIIYPAMKLNIGTKTDMLHTWLACKVVVKR